MLHLTTSTRAPYVIAEDIVSDFRAQGKPVHPYAAPYVQALRSCSSWRENYGCDTAESVALYMLSNLSAWRGEKAREVKAELRVILGLK